MNAACNGVTQEQRETLLAHGWEELQSVETVLVDGREQRRRVGIGVFKLKYKSAGNVNCTAYLEPACEVPTSRANKWQLSYAVDWGGRRRYILDVHDDIVAASTYVYMMGDSDLVKGVIKISEHLWDWD